MIVDVEKGGRPQRDRRRQREAGEGQKPDARRSEILSVARRVFAEKGYANATVRDVGDEAGILSGSLYYHFASKDALLAEILSGALDELLQSYESAVAGAADADDALERLLAAGFHWVVKERHAAKILHNDFAYLRTVERFEFVNAKNAQIKALWIDALQNARAAEVIRKDVDVELAYRVLMGTILSVVRWFDPAGPATADEIVERLTELALNGVATRRP